MPMTETEDAVFISKTSVPSTVEKGRILSGISELDLFSHDVQITPATLDTLCELEQKVPYQPGKRARSLLS
jgi:hypothetical protein